MSGPVLVFEAHQHTRTRERERLVAKVRQLQRVSYGEAMEALEAWLDAGIAKYEDSARRARAADLEPCRGVR